LIIENARLYEENLRQARLSALGQGIAGAAHFVKNLLNGIDGGAYILERGIKKKELNEIDKGFNIMKRNNKLMKSLVLDMLTYSKDREPEYELTDVNQVCRGVVEFVGQKAAQKNVEVLFNPSFDQCETFLDSTGIYRCILNLVSNAIDACDKSQGVVEITTQTDETSKWLKIVISDNGCGISEDNLKKLFSPFFSTKGSKGTGLGLAITQKIISEHGGSVNVESELGKGTTFNIELPLKIA
jgi:signal transduction histidine kinase